jgi:uncharacterized protein YbcC (UPF0753/DUF2309 family)
MQTGLVESTHDGAASSRERLRREILHAAHLLPAQGPISVFIHHNTLHAFEELPFDQAVARGAETLRCNPYLPEGVFRQHWDQSRIRDADIDAVLRDDLGPRANDRMVSESRIDFRRVLLRTGVPTGARNEREWAMAETMALSRYRSDGDPLFRRRLLETTRDWVLRELHLADGNGQIDPVARSRIDLLRRAVGEVPERNIERWTNDDWESLGLHALWILIRDAMQGMPLAPSSSPRLLIRHRDVLLAAKGVDADTLVNDVLIRFCGAYLDQGLAPWTLPGRNLGFFVAFHSLYSEDDPAEPWCRGLAAELRRLAAERIEPIDSIAESLDLLGVQDDERNAFLEETLLALRGFGGMIAHLQERPDRVVHALAADSVVEFLAVRLILDRLALAYLVRSHVGADVPLDGLRPRLLAAAKTGSATIVHREVAVFHAAQLLGWLPADLLALEPSDWKKIAEEIDEFSDVERRRVFHLAFERRYRVKTLDAVSAYRPLPASRSRPRFQVIFCIDEREESMRRHLEEVAPECETFGAAGFFGVAIYFKGAADAHFTPLCPAVIKPSHWVSEVVPHEDASSHERRRGFQRRVGDFALRVHTDSRSLTGGWLSSLVGVAAGLPLVARVLFPRATAALRERAKRLLDPPMTRLQLERTAPAPSEDPEGIGYLLDEMINVSERLLRDIGMTESFARVVVVSGHGSVSMNNPHESAHDCGACGGGRGGPNARAIAQMLNDPRVRTGLAARNLHVPSDSWFVGAMHNTCDESMTYYDLHVVPETHAVEFERVRAELSDACERNAHERCRRFEMAPLSITPEAARRHVESRSQDLSEVRPEYGHATNAVCFVGRRKRTRGLFMDRRTFLVSYDPTNDDDGPAILARILGAVVPVCAGISLEYYFSYVDPTGFGCGTKLPHNITSLLGVMDGAASDLRTGLPWQMVEVHEPMRLLFIVESSAEKMLKVIDGNPTVARNCRNGWVQLAVLDPDSERLQLFDGKNFNDYQPETVELPASPSSLEWYRNRREHLGYAAVVPRSQ